MAAMELRPYQREAIEAIQEAVSARHGLSDVDAHVVPAGAIPRTTSGKLARRACRTKYLDGGFGAV
jgi:fatty-acyl-CoA synthase